MLDVSAISHTSLSQASEELWKQLLPYLAYLAPEDLRLVDLAFTQMVLSHGEQRRKGGEYYFTHPACVCAILADIHVDAHTLAAAFLHDVPEDTKTSLKDLSKDFHTDVLVLVEGVTKYSTLKYRGEQRYAENLRKLFLAMNKDIRIVLIKLADRLHNLMTLEHLRPDKQHRIALESIEIYAPLAERLGISRLRAQIEDLAFPYVYPDVYQSFVSDTRVVIEKRKKTVSKLVEEIKKQLSREKIPTASVKGRAKTYYSLYRKLASKEKTLSEIYDLLAIRIVTYTVEQCYHILSIVHQLFDPLPDRVKDYIIEPKDNGYQSLHTTVASADDTLFEIQIRTKDMDEYAEYGIATHWAYKHGTTPDFNPKKFKWISDLISVGKQWGWQTDYVRKVKMNLYADRIFVLTPKGDVVDLRAGSTALDFAFKIHEKVGQTAVMAKINGKNAKMNDVLSNGDHVEIITRKGQQPTQDWLHKVSSSNAVKKIRSFLNSVAKRG